MKRYLPAAMMVSGALVLVLALLLALVTGRQAEPAGAPLPSRLAGLGLTGRIEGPDAISQIRAMHGEEFALTAASIGTYGADRLTLWVSESATPAEAAQMLTLMT